MAPCDVASCEEACYYDDTRHEIGDVSVFERHANVSIQTLGLWLAVEAETR